MHYYQFHIGDYRAGTAHLSDMEDLTYRRLLDMYYDTEQPIPLDLQWVARRTRTPAEVIPVVLRDFFRETPDGWVNDRADAEIAAYHEKHEQASRAGRASAERRKQARATDVATPVQPTINQEPETSNQLFPHLRWVLRPRPSTHHGDQLAQLNFCWTRITNFAQPFNG